MSSFNETTGLSYLKSQAIDFVQYNKRQMSRIYPRGTRFESTNFLPQVFWNAGCQMVALNFQTPDLAMQLNQGKFEYNGNCGYLLKPDFMRREDKEFDPFADTTVDGVIAAQCCVQVISGQFLSDKKVGTYVEVDMYGLPTDTIRKEFRTRMVPSNGLNPCYNESPFFFRKVVLPDLAVLRFGVFDETGKLLGQRILPLDGLQTGYRHIALRTEANFPMSLPMLFCNIQLKIYVPTGYEDIMYALSDPLKYQSDREKHSKMIQQMGVDDPDDDDKINRPGISDEVVSSSGTMKKGCKIGSKEEAGAATTSTREIGKLISRNSSAIVSGALSLLEKSDVHDEPIKLATLKEEKSFLKLLKKHIKELQNLKRKQHKELMAVQKAQCLAVEKLTKGKSFNTKDELSSNAPVRDVVVEQIKQWTDIKERHSTASWELKKQQLLQQGELLKNLLENAQSAKIKQQEAHHEREIKHLNQKQVKIMVETTREVNNDKTLKSKTEKDRCIREKKQTNVKKFMEDRKQLEVILQRRKEDLKDRLQREKQTVLKELEERLETHQREQRECQLSPRKEFYA